MNGVTKKTEAVADLSLFHDELTAFSEFGGKTQVEHRSFDEIVVPVFRNEFWTAKQRGGHSIHEISYRACYKPQLPKFFIDRLTAANDIVYDPFSGRGTTLVEASLLGRRVIGNDINPLSEILTAPRLAPPDILDVKERLSEVCLRGNVDDHSELLVFFHPDTLSEILGWRKYFSQRRMTKEFDSVDAWLEMIACNRLTGHSKGFFSVYTLPPNQAASIKSQQRINEKRQQFPEYRDTKEIIYRKSHQLLRDKLPLRYGESEFQINIGSADSTPEINSESVDLVVTSPPFLDIVNYRQDNWLRMWFSNVLIDEGAIWQIRSLPEWLAKMKLVFHELYRVLKSSGTVAFEVGEIRKANLLLENEVAKIAIDVGFVVDCILINSQNFTKTANCWGVRNNEEGTNTNRIVILRKHGPLKVYNQQPRQNVPYQQIKLF